MFAADFGRSQSQENILNIETDEIKLTPRKRTTSLSAYFDKSEKDEIKRLNKKVSRSDTMLKKSNRSQQNSTISRPSITECEVDDLKSYYSKVSDRKLPFFHLVLQDDISHRREEKVQFLIEKGFDIEQRAHIQNGREVTPLLFAITLSSIRCMIRLLDAGADVNAVGEFLETIKKGKKIWRKKTALDLAGEDSVLIHCFKNLNNGKTYSELVKKGSRKSRLV